MHNIQNIQLICSEITGIWNSYMYDTMSLCVLKHFANNTQDSETTSAIQHAIKLSSRHINELTDLFNQEGLAIPDGFSQMDFDINAPRLFTDSFYLLYLTHMGRIGMQNYSLILNHIARSDVREYFSKCITECIDLYNRLTDIRLSNGTFIRAPRIEVSQEVEYIKSSGFMSGLLGEKRPLLDREITHIFSNLLSVTMSRALVIGFGQVSKTKKVADHMFKGNDIMSNLIEEFTSILTNEDIPIPSISDSLVTNSIVAPFSEKLMMFHVLAIAKTAISNFGLALADCMRADLTTYYTKLIAIVTNFLKEGADIMIENRWLEQPRQAINHKDLAKV